MQSFFPGTMWDRLATSLVSATAARAHTPAFCRIFPVKFFVLGEEDTGGHTRDRALTALKAHRVDMTASWCIRRRSGRLNSEETARFKRWYGHDLALQ